MIIENKNSCFTNEIHDQANKFVDVMKEVSDQITFTGKRTEATAKKFSEVKNKFKKLKKVWVVRCEEYNPKNETVKKITETSRLISQYYKPRGYGAILLSIALFAIGEVAVILNRKKGEKIFRAAIIANFGISLYNLFIELNPSAKIKIVNSVKNLPTDIKIDDLLIVHRMIEK